MEFHFEARYPDEQKNFYEKCTKEFATKKLQEMKEVFMVIYVIAYGRDVNQSDDRAHDLMCFENMI